MTRRIRNLISMAFIAAFLVSAPLVVMSTAGYKYNWKKRKVEKTGIIQTDSTPDGARIFLNGTAQQRETPSAFPRLLPEDYRVRFEHDGYFPWEKQVEVRSGETAFVTDAALIKDALPLLRFSGAISTVAFSDDGRHAAFLKDEDGQRELLELDADSTEPKLLARFPVEAHDDARITWSSDGGRLLYAAREAAGGKAIALAYDVSVAGTSVAVHEEITRLIDVSWSPDGSQLTALSPAGAFIVDPATGDATLTSAGAAIDDVELRDRTLFLLRKKDDRVILERLVPGSAEAVPFAELPSGQYRFLQHDGPSLLVADLGRGRIRVISPDDGTTLAMLTGTQARWLPNTREPKLLVWNDFEISTFDVRERRERLVTRLGTRIGTCAWHPSGLAIFYSTDNGLYAADLDGREPRNVFSLARFAEIGGFAVDEESGVLRFSGAVGNQRGLYEREF